jgi:predicted ribosome quality control (RQC) complex YloA/Tae2 family protein
MTSFDIRAEVRELSVLHGAFYQKAYSPTDDSLLLRFRQRGGEKFNFLTQLGRFFLATSDDVAVPESPGHLSSMIRKHVSNVPLERIEQHGFDRVVVLSFGRDMDVQLMLELFGKGNAVLVREGRILGLQRSEAWRDRVLRGGIEYSFPSQRIDPSLMAIEDLGSALEGGHDLVRALALGANLGGTYAEEVCLRSGVDKMTIPGELASADIESVFEGIRSIMRDLDDPRPNIVWSDGQMVDVLPIPLERFEGMEIEFIDDFNTALDSYFDLDVAEELTVETVREDRASRIVSRQRASLEEFRRKADEAQAKGDLLYENYQAVEGALMTFRDLLQENDWDHIGPSLPEGIRTMDEYGTIEVRVPGTETWLRLEVKKDMVQNGARYYDEAKKLRGKADGAEAAMGRMSAERAKGSRRRVKRRSFQKDFWYERYRWCLTTGGHMVLGGRDRRTNESLVRKHLKDGDLYVHADIHGAPSCILKGGAAAEDDDRHQACAFAAIYSKAWTSGLGSVPAYWVTPDQVSRTPESGEYLPKGAFIVRGKRNLHHHLGMVLGIGNVEIEGKTKVMAGPPECVSALTDAYSVLEPGDTPKEKVSKLTDLLSASAEEVMRAIPGPYRIKSTEGRAR